MSARAGQEDRRTAAHAATERRPARSAPRTRPGLNLQGVTLTPVEMFVLSRIDGFASVEQLCQITGLPEKETRAALQKLAAVGLVDLPAGAEEGVDLTVEQQKDILDFFERLRDMDFYQMLGVEAGADAKALRRAYFRVSKQFHPDRYYGRRLGPFKARLEEIFVRVSQAFEFLQDARRRAAYATQILAERQRQADGAAARKADARADEPAARPAAEAEGEKAPPRAGGKARAFFEEGLRELRAGDYTAAALALRRAIELDRDNLGYQAQYRAAMQRAGASSADEYLRLAQAEEAEGRLDAAAALYERAARAGGRAEPHARAAEFFLRVGRLIEAKERAQSAAQLDPGRAEWHVVLARVYAAAGFAKKAQREAEIAVHLDPDLDGERLREELGSDRQTS
jgi:curved DNA-binding protein CbpA